MSARTVGSRDSFLRAGKLLIDDHGAENMVDFRQECQRGKTASVRRGEGSGGGIWESSGGTPAGNWESRTRERPRSAKGRNRRSRHGEQEINEQVWIR